MDVPETRYALSDDVRIAYQVMLFEGKVGGIAMHIGAHGAARAAAGEVLVSQTVKDLVAGSGVVFEDRGVPELKAYRATGGSLHMPVGDTRGRPAFPRSLSPHSPRDPHGPMLSE